MDAYSELTEFPVTETLLIVAKAQSNDCAATANTHRSATAGAMYLLIDSIENSPVSGLNNQSNRIAS